MNHRTKAFSIFACLFFVSGMVACSKDSASGGVGAEGKCSSDHFHPFGSVRTPLTEAQRDRAVAVLKAERNGYLPFDFFILAPQNPTNPTNDPMLTLVTAKLQNGACVGTELRGTRGRAGKEITVKGSQCPIEFAYIAEADSLAKAKYTFLATYKDRSLAQSEFLERKLEGDHVGELQSDEKVTGSVGCMTLSGHLETKSHGKIEMYAATEDWLRYPKDFSHYELTRDEAHHRRAYKFADVTVELEFTRSQTGLNADDKFYMNGTQLTPEQVARYGGRDELAKLIRTLY